jgi:hypothetical protein
MQPDLFDSSMPETVPLPAPVALAPDCRDCRDCLHYRRQAGGGSCRAKYFYTALAEGVDMDFPGCESLEEKKWHPDASTEGAKQ